MKIEELHDHLYEILCTIDDICKKNKIRYFLDSGTELGAVREKNFIPWDDDMDIKVLIEDYPKFKQAMERELPSYMHLIEPDAFAPSFYDFTIRIYDERYCMHDMEKTADNRVQYENYVGTDVFLFSKAPEGAMKQKWIMLMSKIYYGMAMGHRTELDYSKYSFVEKMQVKVLKMLGHGKSVKTIWDKYITFCNKWKNKDVPYYYPLNYPITNVNLVYKRFFDKKIYEADAYGMIRNRKFPVPGGFDQELTQIYGDYMVPPKDKSVFRHHL